MNNVLVVMRLMDMARIHPQQDDSRVCARCGAQVGIYPSGQAALKKDPSMLIVCSVCAEQDRPAVSVSVPAPGALGESRESVDNPRSPEERERLTQELIREMRKKGWTVRRAGDRE